LNVTRQALIKRPDLLCACRRLIKRPKQKFYRVTITDVICLQTHHKYKNSKVFKTPLWTYSLLLTCHRGSSLTLLKIGRHRYFCSRLLYKIYCDCTRRLIRKSSCSVLWRRGIGASVHVKNINISKRILCPVYTGRTRHQNCRVILSTASSHVGLYSKIMLKLKRKPCYAIQELNFVDFVLCCSVSLFEWMYV